MPAIEAEVVDSEGVESKPMTDWIDEIAERRRRAEVRGSKISNGAPQVYEALWQEIERLVLEAVGKGIPVSADDHSHERPERRTDREVSLRQSKTSTLTMRMKLSKDKSEEPVIEITGTDPKLEPLHFDLSGDRIVLKNADIPTAARAILEPFLNRCA